MGTRFLNICTALYFFLTFQYSCFAFIFILWTFQFPCKICQYHFLLFFSWGNWRIEKFSGCKSCLGEKRKSCLGFLRQEKTGLGYLLVCLVVPMLLLPEGRVSDPAMTQSSNWVVITLFRNQYWLSFVELMLVTVLSALRARHHLICTKYFWGGINHTFQMKKHFWKGKMTWPRSHS